MTGETPSTVVISENFAIEFCKLCDGLQRAFCDAGGDGPDHSRASTLRARYIVALGKLAYFFDAIHQDDLAALGIAQRFMELGAILQDLNEGNKHPVLTPSGKSGRKVRFDIWVLRDQVVQALQVLQRAGIDATVAANTIAKRYPDLARLKRDAKENLATAILSWERGLKDGAVANDIVRDIFRGGVDLLDQSIGQAPSQLLKHGAGDLKKVAYEMVSRTEARARALVFDDEYSDEPTTISGDGQPRNRRAVLA